MQAALRDVVVLGAPKGLPFLACRSAPEVGALAQRNPALASSPLQLWMGQHPGPEHGPGGQQPAGGAGAAIVEQFDLDGPLGLGFEQRQGRDGGIYLELTSVDPQVAEERRQLAAGQVLQAVDGRGAVGVPQEEVYSWLQARPVTLSFVNP